MILSNSGGLITQGFGQDSRVITQGYGGQPDFGGVFNESIEHLVYDLKVPIIKEIDYNNRLKVNLISKEKKTFKLKNPLKVLEKQTKKVMCLVKNKKLKLIKRILDII